MTSNTPLADAAADALLKKIADMAKATSSGGVLLQCAKAYALVVGKLAPGLDEEGPSDTNR